MTGHPVFDRQHGCGCLGVFKKQGIMADAQTQQDIEFRSGTVQGLGLEDGIAHGLIGTLKNLFFLLDPDLCLGCSAGLAHYGNHFKAIGLEDPFDDFGLFGQADAKGQA